MPSCGIFATGRMPGSRDKAFRQNAFAPSAGQRSMKKALGIFIGISAVTFLGGWFMSHLGDRRISWRDASQHVGRRVTVVGPVFGGVLDHQHNRLAILWMGTKGDSNAPQVNIVMPHECLDSSWRQADLEKGRTMAWNGWLRSEGKDGLWLSIDR